MSLLDAGALHDDLRLGNKVLPSNDTYILTEISEAIIDSTSKLLVLIHVGDVRSSFVSN